MLGSLAITLAVWGAFSWPLPRFLRHGIPMSSQNVEQGHVRAMLPGDHLQLLYHFELARDMVAGRIPWFHNVYEFNTGRDEDRYRPGAYYAPFSLPYALLASLGGRAFAWNVTGLLSLWLTTLGTLWLLRRYTTNTGAMFLGTLAAIALPFRWVNLLGGSPSGLAMMWLPWIVLGVDLAVREHRASGGLLAGAALLLCCWSDLQIFFFCVCSLPLWVLVALASRPAGRPLRQELRHLFKAAIPIALFLLVAALYRFVRHDQLTSSSMAGGRSLVEVRMFSPSWRGFWQWMAEGLQSHIYIGFVLPLLLAGSAVGVVRTRSAAGARTRVAVFFMLLAAILLVLLLALGAQGPFGGLLLKVFRKLIPPFAMVRQTAKIFCLLPTLLALTLAIGWTALTESMPFVPRRPVRWTALVMILLALEWRAQVRPTICLLEDQQAAYAAVQADAKARDLEPHVLILPLWPGDSSWASIYEYFVQMYGLRMVNGYSPAVRQAYVDQVFRFLESVNQGWLTEEQLARLAEMNVRYILVHENAFPEKVSPFPVGRTLQRLSAHPRLRRLAQAENVWAYVIDADGAAPTDSGPMACDTWFPARRFEIEQTQSEGAACVEDEDAGGGAFLRFDAPTARAETRPARVAPADDLRWLVRGRGTGRIQARTLESGEPAATQTLAFDGSPWTWQEIPITSHDRFQPLALRMSEAEGSVDLDLALLVSGNWPADGRITRRDIAPACLFHGGYTDADGRSVVLRVSHDPVAALLYGPKLPLAPGRYRVRLLAEGNAPEGTVLGRMNVRVRDEDESGFAELRSGVPTEILWDQNSNLPVNVVVVYSRQYDCKVKQFAIEVLDEMP